MTRIYHAPDDIDPYARELIRHKVRRLVGHYGYTGSDRDDLTQELALQAHVATQKYDPTRGAVTTFLDRVLTRKVASLVAAATAQKRDRRREQALDDVPQHRPEHTHVALRLDVGRALCSLPHDVAPLAARFMQGDSESQAARSLRWTRGEVRHRRSLLARHLRRAGVVPEREGARR